MRDRSSIVKIFVVEATRQMADFSPMETGQLTQPENSKADQELGRRIRIITQTYENGLSGFFEQIERDQKAYEHSIAVAKETDIRRLIGKSLL